MTFPDFLEKKYLEWQLAEGRKTTIEFSAFLGVSQPLLSMWMSGKKRPGVENIKMLAEIFGLEVYDSLGIPRPNPYLQKINRVWEHVPEDVQKRLAEEAEIYETENETLRVQKIPKRKKTAKNK